MNSWISIPMACIGLTLIALSFELKTRPPHRSLQMQGNGPDFAAGDCIARRIKTPLEHWGLAGPGTVLVIKKVGKGSYLTDEYTGSVLRYRDLPYKLRSLTKDDFEKRPCPDDLRQ